VAYHIKNWCGFSEKATQQALYYYFLASTFFAGAVGLATLTLVGAEGLADSFFGSSFLAGACANAVTAKAVATSANTNFI